MLSRRGFINTTLGAGAALAAQGAQPGSAQAPAAQPARKRLIVDAQIHLWKAETPDWKWVPGMTPQLPEPFTIEKLVPLMTEAGVDRVVVVPPSWPGDRNDYGLEAARAIDRFAVMPPRHSPDPKQAALLPSGKTARILGVRVTFTRSPALPAGCRTAGGLVLAGGREGRPSRDVSRPREHAGFRQDRRASPATRPRHRPHGAVGRHRQGRQDCGGAHGDRHARQVSERVHQAVVVAALFVGALSVPRHERAPQALLRRLRSAKLPLGDRHHQFADKATTASASRLSSRIPVGRRQGLDHGRAIVAKLGWT